MCERFTLRSAWSDIQRMYRLFDLARTNLSAPDHFDRTPGETVVFVTAGEQGRHTLREGQWGLVPWKAKEAPNPPVFNARTDVIDTSSTFKDAWASKRCLIPADGFYVIGKDGSPWFIHKPGGRPFSFAGLWAKNNRLGITSCVLITLPATEPVAQLHRAQPAILSPEVYDAWLNPSTPVQDLKLLLDSNLESDLEFHSINSAFEERRPSTAVDERAALPVSREVRPVEAKGRPISRPNGSPSEGPNEILIDRGDPLLARRSGIVTFWCQHEGCANGAFWGYSANGQGQRNWFCNEHRADGEAMLGRKPPKGVPALNQIR